MALSPDEATSYFESAVDRFGGWVQYGDTKAGAVLVVLGLGLSNLVDAAPDLIDTHGWGYVATAFAPPHDPSNDSVLYYRDVAFRPSADAYEDEVVAMQIAELNHHRAVEAYGFQDR